MARQIGLFFLKLGAINGKTHHATNIIALHDRRFGNTQQTPVALHDNVVIARCGFIIAQCRCRQRAALIGDRTRTQFTTGTDNLLRGFMFNCLDIGGITINQIKLAIAPPHWKRQFIDHVAQAGNILSQGSKITNLAFTFAGMAGFIAKPHRMAQHRRFTIPPGNRPRHMKLAAINRIYPDGESFVGGFQGPDPVLQDAGIFIAQQFKQIRKARINRQIETAHQGRAAAIDESFMRPIINRVRGGIKQMGKQGGCVFHLRFVVFCFVKMAAHPHSKAPANGTGNRGTAQCCQPDHG